MSEILEEFAIRKQISKGKKAENLKYSTNKLKELGVNFESKNDGLHLIINHGNKVVNFYPSTGKYICNKHNINNRGLKNLIKFLGFSDE